MISPKFFYDTLANCGIDFYAGVPDSLLKNLCATLTTEQDGHELSWNLKRWNIFTIPDNLATARKALDEAKNVPLGQRPLATGGTQEPERNGILLSHAGD